jgi:ribosomal protein S27AE
MFEDYCIISPPRGEPRSLGDVGVRVRVQLSGRPGARWSRALGARLTRELAGHPGATHLRVKITELVQGDEIVLDGIEDRETHALADALQRAVDAANRAQRASADRPTNVTQREADTVASHIPLSDSRDTATAGTSNGPPCPRCGQPVLIAAGDRAAGDQLALSEMDCPNCGAHLRRAVEGHADHGWCIAD